MPRHETGTRFGECPSAFNIFKEFQRKINNSSKKRRQENKQAKMIRLRRAFDVGSGSVKCQVARVDVTTSKIQEILYAKTTHPVSQLKWNDLS